MKKTTTDRGNMNPELGLPLSSVVPSASRGSEPEGEMKRTTTTDRGNMNLELGVTLGRVEWAPVRRRSPEEGIPHFEVVQLEPEAEGGLPRFSLVPSTERPDLVAARRFVANYYRTFDEANRADLVNLYQEEAVLIFDGVEFQGKEAILAKLTSLPLQQCQHDVQVIVPFPVGDDPSNGVNVSASGNIRLDGKEDARRFIQLFRLIPTPTGSFSVWFEVFRMNYGSSFPPNSQADVYHMG